MRLIRRLIFASLHLPYLFAKACGSGAFGPDGAQPVVAPDFHGNRLKEALFRHYVHQFNPAACSVATVATTINAIAEIQGQRRSPITQQDLLNAVRTAHWKERMHGQGHRGRRGLPLALLATVVQDSLATYGIRYRSIEAFQAAKPATSAARKIEAGLRARLHRFETRGDTLIIAHFDQGAVVPALNIPHISPVGGFDARSGAVTILDVDSDQQPYQVSLETFHRAIASDYHHLFRPFGYGRGGYLALRLP